MISKEWRDVLLKLSPAQNRAFWRIIEYRDAHPDATTRQIHDLFINDNDVHELCHACERAGLVPQRRKRSRKMRRLDDDVLRAATTLFTRSGHIAVPDEVWI